MRRLPRQLRIRVPLVPLLKGTALVGAVWGLVQLTVRVPEALAAMSTFDVAEVEVEGLRYLDQATVVELARVDPGANLWDDPVPWVERLEASPLIDSASVRRRFPHTLVLRVVEREPVALVAGAVLEPVDREGNLLPLDPTRVSLDLPVLTVERRGVGGPGADPAGAATPGRGPVQGNDLPALARLAHTLRADPDFFQGVSEILPGAYGSAVIRWGRPEVRFLVSPQVETRRIQEGARVLADARERRPDRRPRAIDLRFADDVYVDWGPGGRP